MFAFLLLIPGPPSLDAIGEFGRVSDNVREQLNRLGLGSGSLFIGAGIDENVVDCELLFTPVFTRLDDVQTSCDVSWKGAVGSSAMGCCRAPVSGGGFAIVESSAG